MSIRVAALAVSLTLILSFSGTATAASSAEARAAEARALRAQIDRMDHDLQSLESQLYHLEHDQSADPARADKETAVRGQIHRLDHDQELLENRLRELEHEDPAILAETASAGEASGTSDHYGSEVAPPPAPVAAPPPPMLSAAPPPPPSPAPPAFGPTLRQAADPAPYEKAVIGYVSMFHYNPYKWIPVGTHQVVIYNTYDEAYLLDLANDCPGLLSTDHIQVENFSTKVVVNRDAVIADHQRCPITGIRELNTNHLPL